MKDLEIRNFYRTKVSNAGLEAEALHELKEVDCGIRATSAGVASLRAALPNATLNFRDGEPVSKNGAAPALTGKNDKAVADRVHRSVEAVMEDGSL